MLEFGSETVALYFIYDFAMVISLSKNNKFSDQ